MTTPVLEDDVVERLRSRRQFWLNGAHWLMSTDPDPDCQEAAALIEQQRRTIEELTVCLAESLKESVDTRAKTIEECAKVAESRVSSMQTAADAMAMNIAKAIRSMDGGGK